MVPIEDPGSITGKIPGTHSPRLVTISCLHLNC